MTGPVRSGKSSFAASLAQRSDTPITYLATAHVDPDDAEWCERIARHRAQRPAHWVIVETATWSVEQLCAFVRDRPSGETVLLESLGTWLGGRVGLRAAEMLDEYLRVEAMLDDEASMLADALIAGAGRFIVVCEQVGWDVVPPMPSARLFRDVLGRLGQRLARASDQAFLVVSGFALDLRSGSGSGLHSPTAAESA